MARTKKKNEVMRLAVYLPIAEAKQLRSLAKYRHRTITDTIRTAISIYVGRALHQQPYENTTTNI